DVDEVCRMCCRNCNSYKQITRNTYVVALGRPGRGMARHVLSDAVRTGWSAVPYAPKLLPCASEFDRCENDHAVDTLRRVVAAVAAGSRQLVHTRWIHPPVACTRGRRRTRAADYRQAR